MNVPQRSDINLDAVVFSGVIFLLAFLIQIYFDICTRETILGSLVVTGFSYPIASFIFKNNYLNIPIKLYWFVALAAIFLFTILFIYDYYSLSGVEEGKINCIFPDGTRKSIPIGETHNKELISIFPQLNNTPFVGVQTYATNGKISSKFYKDEFFNGLANYEITFKNYCPSLDCNCGWMIGPLSGFDASNYSHLSFQVMGKKGGEKFGVKLKDTKGCESKINVTEMGLEITTNWQNVEIPLDHFVYIFDVDISKLNIISIFSDGSLYSGKDQETIYVRGFKFSSYINNG